MKIKSNSVVSSVVFLGLLAFSAQAQDVGPRVPTRVPLIIKQGIVDLAKKTPKTLSAGQTVPGQSSAFEVTVGAVPAAHLTNGKLKMRFNAFKVRVEKSTGTNLKLVQTSTTPMPATDFASGQFTGNNEIDLTPSSANSIEFQLDEDVYDGEDDFLLLIVGRAAYPATGSESVVYETATVYSVDCP